MTEKQKTDTRRAALAWQRARHVSGMCRVNQLTDWPDSLAPGEIAALQYPQEGGEAEKRKTLINQTALFAQLRFDITGGVIPTVAAVYTPARAPTRRFSRSSYLTHEYGNPVPQPPEPAPQTIETIEREHLSAWLVDYGIEPSGHLHAWLGDQAQPAQAPESASSQAEAPAPHNDGRATRKREKQIQSIEKAAHDLGYLDPLKIPTGGKAAIKAHCIAWPAFGHSESAFRAAWRVANKEGRIRLTEKEKYM